MTAITGTQPLAGDPASCLKRRQIVILLHSRSGATSLLLVADESSGGGYWDACLVMVALAKTALPAPGMAVCPGLRIGWRSMTRRSAGKEDHG